MERVLMILTVILLAAFIILLYMNIQKNKKIEKMSKLYDIGKKITSNIKIKKLIEEIMEIVKKEMDAEASSLYLIDKEKGELWFEVALGDKSNEVKEIRLKLGEGVAGWVALEGKTLNLKDVNNDPRFRKDIGEKIEFKQKAMLTMPVKYMDETIGVIQIINKNNGGHFTSEDEELLSGMCSQIAIALENAKLYQATKDLFVESIMSLAGAIDAKDAYTNGHSRRVTEYSVAIGKEMGLTDEQLEDLEFMAILHDVGKIGIRDAILNKQAVLDDDEFAIMKSHTKIGAKIMEEMRSLRRLAIGAKYHHEKYNGTGYYEGLKEDEIPFEARIIAVADAYDAMTTDRPYRKGLSHEVAINEIKRCAGTHFDPDVAEAFYEAMKRKLDS